MFRRLLKVCLIGVLSIALVACYTNKPPLRPDYQSYMQEAARLFKDGYYKKAKLMLYPLACDGLAQAEYALGYMYYYGYGVTQDTDVGYFWIKRAAAQNYPPAVKAASMINLGK